MSTTLTWVRQTAKTLFHKLAQRGKVPRTELQSRRTKDEQPPGPFTTESINGFIVIKDGNGSFLPFDTVCDMLNAKKEKP